MLRREFAAYQRLAGVPGVPRCLGLRDGQELVLEFIEGRPLREARDHLADADAFFGALRDVVQAIHRAGVAHADMKRKDNILVTRDEQPFLIDFGIAAVRRDGAGPLGRYLFRQACRIDLNAWVKLKYQRSDREMSAEDALLYRPTLAERVARPVRTFWRRINGRRWRQARRRERAERASGGRGR
jgi:predicted Ser/Thr protein kinase